MNEGGLGRQAEIHTALFTAGLEVSLVARQSLKKQITGRVIYCIDVFLA